MKNQINLSCNNLIKGTILYTIAIIMSKILQILILPVITTLFSTSEYGYYDYLITISAVIIPIFTMQVFDGVFRFLFDAENNEKLKIISTSIFIIISSMLLLGIGFYICKMFVNNNSYLFSLYIYIATNTLYLLFQRIARGLGFNKVFAISGIVFTIILLSTQYFFIIFLGYRINGMLAAGSIASIISIAYIVFFVKIYKYVRIIAIEYKMIVNLIVFSAPLIPNSLCIWLISSMNRIIIVDTLGVSYNGIYAIANKFPSLITLATYSFQLAWQESSIQLYGKDEQDDFNSIVYNKYIELTITVSCLILMLIGIIFDYIIGKSFVEAKKYLPILFASSIIYSFALFYGAGYLSSKKTGGAVSTTLLGAIICVSITFIFINHIGLFAPALGTFFGYYIMLVARKIQMKSYFKINIDKKESLLLIIIYIMSTLVYYINNIYITILSLLIITIYIYIKNKEIFKNLLLNIGGKFA